MLWVLSLDFSHMLRELFIKSLALEPCRTLGTVPRKGLDFAYWFIMYYIVYNVIHRS